MSGDLESELEAPPHTGSKGTSLWRAFILEFRLTFFPEAQREGPKGKMGRVTLMHSLISIKADWEGESRRGGGGKHGWFQGPK